MDINTMNALAASLTADMGGQTTQSSQQQSGPSFNDMMKALAASQQSTAASTTAKPKQTPAAQTTSTAPASNLTYRDLQALQKALNLNPAAQQLSNQSDSTAPILGDILTQLFQILGTMTGDELETLDFSTENGQDLLDLMTQMQKQLQDLLNAGGQEMAGSEMLLLMAQITEQNLVPVVKEDGTLSLELEGGNALLENLVQSNPQDLLQSLANNMLAQQAGQDAANTAQPETPLRTGTPQAEAPQFALPEQPAQTTEASPAPVQPQQTAQPLPQAASTNTDAPQADVFIAEGEASQSEGVQPVNPEASFREAVETVKAQLEGQPETQEKTTLDLDALQQQVDNGVHMRNTNFAIQVPESPEGEAPAPVSTQLTDGIQTALARGEEQFTLRLMPEGLGELEVRLTKTAEGMTLNIVAKNAETQKVLAAEMDMLKQNLKPLDVRVESILTAQQDALLNQQQAFYQQGSQNRNALAQQQGARTMAGAAGTEENPEALPPEATNAGNSMLDTYI